MKRKITSALTFLLALALLVSCGAGGDDLVIVGRDNVTASTADTADITEASDTAAAGDSPLAFASYSGTEAGGDLTYTTCRGKTITDFSFLDGLSRDFFSDTADKENGSWYCGISKRDPESGEVTTVMERAADVLEALEKYDVVYRKNEDEKIIYITFDCGYETGYTDDILDILKEKEVKASFFLNGQYIKTSPELVKRMLDEGHVVGNHGNNHRVMSRLSLEEFFYEIESMNELLREAVPDAPYMEYFRPSYGSCSEWDMALAQAMDLKEILYSWTYYDYDPEDQPSPAAALESAKSGLRNGSVLMFHTVGETNTKILGDFIDYARAEGFVIGDITE